MIVGSPRFIVTPSIYKRQVRKGARIIRVECTLEREGTVGILLNSPTKTFVEDDMEIMENTVIHVSATPAYTYTKRAVLKIPPPKEDEVWTLQLNLPNIYEYTVSVEVA